MRCEIRAAMSRSSSGRARENASQPSAHASIWADPPTDTVPALPRPVRAARSVSRIAASSSGQSAACAAQSANQLRTSSTVWCLGRSAGPSARPVSAARPEDTQAVAAPAFTVRPSPLGPMQEQSSHRVRRR
jgi:hypothetical protein